MSHCSHTWESSKLCSTTMTKTHGCKIKESHTTHVCWCGEME